MNPAAIDQDASNADGSPTFGLTPARVRELSVVHPALGLAHAGLEWLLVLGAVWLCETHWSPVAYALCVVWIGARQNAIGALVHDGAHGRLLPARRWNDAVTELLCAWPLFVSVKTYRPNHNAHHRHFQTDADPDWIAHREDPAYDTPSSLWTFARLFVRDMTGLGVVGMLKTVKRLSRRSPREAKAPAGRPVARLAFYLALALLFTALGAWKLVALYWLVPLVTYLKWALYLRSFAEHHGFGAGREGLLANTRTTVPGWLGRIFVAPKNCSYHIEHHLYPSVPFYRLPTVHRELMAQPGFRRSAQVARSFVSVMRDAVRAGG